MENVLDLITLKGRKHFYPLNSYNPWRLEGKKTLAFEIVGRLKRTPDAVIVPVGNGGNISAIWKGFKELYEMRIIGATPRMIGVQAGGVTSSFYVESKI